MTRRNPVPTAAIRSRAWYHGAATRAAAERIAIEGIRAPSLALDEKPRRGHFAPVRGRVYITPELSLAVMHAIGADMAGSDLPEYILLRGGFGYVLVIDGRDLADVQPDEDSVGEVISDALDGQDRAIYDPGKKLWRSDPSFMVGLASFAKKALTAQQLKKLGDGEYRYIASGGKRAIKKMPEAWQIKIIEAGGHVAHAGASLHPVEAWEIDKSMTKQLKRDYSNFFEVAQQVWP